MKEPARLLRLAKKPQFSGLRMGFDAAFPRCRGQGVARMRGAELAATLGALKVTFQPSQLEAAIHAPLLRRAVDELFSAQALGEVLVVRPFCDDPMTLVYRVGSQEPVTVDFDRQMLYSEGTEEQLFDRVRELRDRHLTRRTPRGK